MVIRPQAIGQRGLLATAILLLLIAASMFGTLFYLLARPYTPPARTSFNASGLPILSSQERQTIIDKAKMLRDKWKVWGLAHKEALKQLAHASDKDQKALMQVYDALPANPTPQNAGFSEQELSSLPFQFTWNPGTKNHHLNAEQAADPKAQKYMDKEKQFAVKRLQAGFLRLRDVEIAQAINFGPDQYELWASGRITELSYIRQPSSQTGMLPGQTSTQHGWVRREISPPYDFLR